MRHGSSSRSCAWSLFAPVPLSPLFPSPRLPHPPQACLRLFHPPHGDAAEPIPTPGRYSGWVGRKSMAVPCPPHTETGCPYDCDAAREPDGPFDAIRRAREGEVEANLEFEQCPSPKQSPARTTHADADADADAAGRTAPASPQPESAAPSHNSPPVSPQRSLRGAKSPHRTPQAQAAATMSCD